MHRPALLLTLASAVQPGLKDAAGAKMLSHVLETLSAMSTRLPFEPTKRTSRNANSRVLSHGGRKSSLPTLVSIPWGPMTAPPVHSSRCRCCPFATPFLRTSDGSRLNVDVIFTHALELYKGFADTFFDVSEKAAALRRFAVRDRKFTWRRLPLTFLCLLLSFLRPSPARCTPPSSPSCLILFLTPFLPPPPPSAAASRARAYEAEAMASLAIFTAATATSRDRAEKLEALLMKTLETKEAALAMTNLYRATVRAVALLGMNFPTMTQVATDTLRRFLFEPSALLQSLQERGGEEGPRSRKYLSAADLIGDAAVEGLSQLTCHEGVKQHNSGAALIASISLSRTLAEDAQGAEGIRQQLLLRHGIRTIASIAEAVADDEANAVTQAATMLYQRLMAGPSPLDTETLLALVRAGTAGPAQAFDGVFDMLLSLALQMLSLSFVAAEEQDAEDKQQFRYLERDDAMTTALVQLFALAPEGLVTVGQRRGGGRTGPEA